MLPLFLTRFLCLSLFVTLWPQILSYRIALFLTEKDADRYTGKVEFFS